MILIDNNISYKIKSTLRSLQVISFHLSDFNLSTRSDIEIWNFAKSNNYHLLTKDKDFVNIQNNYGYPPKVIRLKVGNLSTSQIATIMKENWDQISIALNNDQIGVIDVGG